MRACQKNGMPFIYMKRLNHALNHKERTKSANRTAVSDSAKVLAVVMLAYTIIYMLSVRKSIGLEIVEYWLPSLIE